MSQKTRPRDAGNNWTVDTLREHWLALREADDRFTIERDKRYAEVNIEREKALKIKETADLAALTLAREIQSYKDEKVEKSREQNLRESGEYVTRGDLDTVVRRIESSLTPIFDFISSQKGGAANAQVTLARIVAAIGASGVVLGLIYWVVERITHIP